MIKHIVIWTLHNPADAPFTCNNKLVGARVFLDTYRANTGLTAEEFDSARDNEGHGTHTASTAAGNADVRAQIFGVDKGTTSGIAPRAQIIARNRGMLSPITAYQTAEAAQCLRTSSMTTSPSTVSRCASTLGSRKRPTTLTATPRAW